MGPYRVVRTGRNRYTLKDERGRSIATKSSRWIARSVAVRMWYASMEANRKDGADDG